ncbi:enoyl-CoA hydratase-related protein [Comamonas sp. lk]|uniref:enoyl-CoA hydratase/isomerase family protein n=1 Tax=Comamonas sp. lk TaxID=2201272 RepID=UPI000EAE6CE7|nr:enoyl-CoA hydratase-related protein [Comamonas sp. lk]
MSELLLIERRPLGHGFAECWRLNAPATRNALSDEMVQALLQACARAEADQGLRAIVLTSSGAHFCAGGSLRSFSGAIGKPCESGATDPLIAVNRGFGRLLQALAGLPQQLIVAVQGAAMGGGVGLVCTADVVLASADASFATPEVTLGIVPAQIAPFVLRRLGEARAREWLLGGQRWTADQALAAGLVNQVVAGDFEAQIQTRLALCSAAAPGAVAATKALLAAVPSQSLDAVLDQAAQIFAQALRGTEAAAGLQAFANKRPAPWASGQEVKA